MPSKPYRRRSSLPSKKETVSAGALAKLYDVERYDRNEVTLSQINRIRDIIDLVGGENAAERIGVSEKALLRLCAGFGHRLTTVTAARIREFLSSKK